MHVFVLCLNYTIVTLRFKDNIKYIDDKDSKEILLIDKKGTEFHITPIDKTHIKFQQVSKDGTLGSTDAVEFVKKQY